MVKQIGSHDHSDDRNKTHVDYLLGRYPNKLTAQPICFFIIF